MRAVSIAVASASIGLIALTLVPALADYRPFLVPAALAAAAVVLVSVLVGWKEAPAASLVRVESVKAAPTPPLAAVKAAPPPVATNQAEAEVVSFLALLQEKGRLVDFVMDDITPYSDAQVGAAARVVHDGCKAVLRDNFRIVPVRDESEGSKVAVTPGYRADEYRLVGKISGQPPFTGTLMHRGWKTETVKLPRMLRTDEDRLPAIAPAEVELQ
ncbi:MAG: DUF2760 domain-containing protein [Vulcanimicrobiaceae bacterium]